MRGLFRYVVGAFILVVVFLVSALTAMRFAIHGRQTAVPKLVGMTPREAERVLAQNGLILDHGDRYYSETVPEGHITSQAPDAGVQVRRGWRVKVAESMGPQRVVIPNLVGGSERAADINIRRRGLEVGGLAVAEVPGAQPNTIVAQSPPANATNVSAPKVGILLAAPPALQSYVMPDLRGRSEDEAINAIVAAGLHVSNITSQPVSAAAAGAPNSIPPGTRIVLKTTPAPGQRVYADQGIALEVTR